MFGKRTIFQKKMSENFLTENQTPFFNHLYTDNFYTLFVFSINSTLATFTPCSFFTALDPIILYVCQSLELELFTFTGGLSDRMT